MSTDPHREPMKQRDRRLIVAAMVVGVSGLILWRAVESDSATRLSARIGDRRRLVREETTAPGARELGTIGPCGQVMIMSPETRAKLRAERRRKNAGREPPPEVTIVRCVAKLFTPAPTCEALARAYVDSAHPTGPFRISVTKPGDAESGCVADYDSYGAALADASPP